MGEFLDTLSELSPILIWIGLGVCIGIASAALFFSARHVGARISARELDQFAPESSPSLDNLATGAPDEKRHAARRKGRQVQVDISAVDDPEITWIGRVLDRSSGGLRIISDQPIDSGSILRVRVSGEGKFMPWIEIHVKHCKSIPLGWELGCRFVRPPTWNILLSFG